MTDKPRSGFALIFTSAMLALLALLATVFVSSSAMERAVSANFVHATAAQLAVESGLEFALSRLQELSGGPIGEADWQALGFDESQPVEQELHDGDVAQLRRYYRVSAADESGKLNLNDSLGMWSDGRGRLEALFAGLLDLILDAQPAAATAAPAPGGRGAAIASAVFHDSRHGRAAYPGDRFPGLEALQRALANAGLSVDEVPAVLREVTLYSWRDDAVQRPANLLQCGKTPADAIGMTLATQREFEAEEYVAEPRSPVNVNAASVELLQAIVRPVRGIYLEEGPADTQSSEHYGWWATGMGAADPNAHVLGRVRETRAMEDTQARRLALAMHDRIHGMANGDLAAGQQDPDGDGVINANPFRTWEEFRHFLEAGLTDDASAAIWIGGGFDVVDTKDIPVAPAYVDPHLTVLGFPIGPYRNGSTTRPQHWQCRFNAMWSGGRPESLDWWNRYYAQRQRDAILANANPNTLLQAVNPNANLAMTVDKIHLTAHTTEFCFEPTGVFSITSTGRVSTPAGTLAEREITAVARVFDVLRITTQAQFLAGLTSVEDVIAYLPAAAPEAQWQSPWTAGAQAHAAGPHRPALQSYPEALYPGNESVIAVSTVDGYLMPATWENRKNETNETIAAHFNGDGENPLELDLFSYQQYSQWDPWNNLHAAPSTVDAAEPAVLSGRGSLHPDGVYCEEGRAYALKMGNFGNLGMNGALGFWMKPNYRVGIAHRMRKIVCGPSRMGLLGRQVFPALYFFPNACENTETGNSDISNGAYGWMSRQNWMPTRALAFGWAWQNQQPSETFNRGYFDSFAAASFIEAQATSKAVSRDYALAPTVAPEPDAPHLEGHQWNHLGIFWSAKDAGCQKLLGLWVNGAWVSRTNALISTYNYVNIWPYQTGDMSVPVRSWNRVSFADEWLRFGELPDASIATATRRGSPYQADSTIDEIEGYSYDWIASPMTGMPTFHVDRYGRLPQIMQSSYAMGRYYNQVTTDAAGIPVLGRYVTPAMDLQRVFCTRSAVALRSVSWTVYRPAHNRAANSDKPADTVLGVTVNPHDGNDPMARHWASGAGSDGAVCDPISVDVRLPGSREWAYEKSGRLSERLTDPAGGSPVDATLRFDDGQDFQLNVAFHLAGNQVLYEAPVLDDLTCTFRLAAPSVLEWRLRGE